MPASATTAPTRVASRIIVVAPLLILSAFLLVALPPVLANLALPSLGGGALAWTAALVAAYAGLVLGYLGDRALAARTSAEPRAVHVGILAAAALTSPAVITSMWPAAAETPNFLLVALFTAALAVPTAALAARFLRLRRRLVRISPTTAPGTAAGLGGLGAGLALLAHPLAIEPALTVAQQAWSWTSLCLFLIGTVTGLRPPTRAPAQAGPIAAAVSRHIGRRERIHWMALAFVPAGLLVCATTRIMGEFAAASLFWAVPLAIYLATLVLAFVRVKWLREGWIRMAHVPLLLLGAIFSTFTPARFGVLALGLALGVLLLAALDCHGQLARRRLAGDHGPDFPLCVLIGAMSGSAFAAMLAPSLFDFPIEYAVLLVLSGLLRRPTDQSEETATAGYRLATSSVAREISAPAAGLGILVLFSPRLGEGGAAAAALLGVVVMFLLVFALLSSGRPIRFGLCVGVLALFGAEMAASQSSTTVHRARGVLGAYQVKRTGENGYLLFLREDALHGAQHLAESRRRERHTYYYAESGAGRLFAALDRSNAPANVAVIGLGVGELACYKQPHQHWTFFERDPEVARIAGSGRYFQFLRQCAADARIVLGHAPTMIAREQTTKYDVLIVDAPAFNPVPTHLLTRKALDLYLERLRPGGVILIHISSRHFNLEPALAALADGAGLAARVLEARPSAKDAAFRMHSVWAVMGRDPEALQALTEGFHKAGPSGLGAWRPLRQRPGYRAWTDDYADLVGALR